MKNSSLGVGLIDPKAAINYLAIKLHTGNKRSIGELTSMINAHEEMG